MSDSMEQHSGLTLSPTDSAALDALLEADMDVARVPESTRAAAERVGKLLGLLEADDIVCDSALIDVTMQRLVRQGEPVLSGQDAEALDAWALSGYRVESTPHALRGRAARHEELASVVRDVDLEATPFLVEKTFQAIAQRAASDRAAGISMPSARGWRISDLVSVAAMLLIGASILWPTLSYMGQKGRQLSCAAGLGSVASAMGVYANNHRDSLPLATAGFGGAPWWDVSPDKPKANSSNLFTLARTGYARLRDLACSGNPKADRSEVKKGAFDWSNLESISYSYQIMAGPARPNWCRAAGEPASMVVLADRSPVVLRAINREVIDPLENSPNHGGTGQYVLLADGSVRWMASPERANGDNIWLPRAVEAIIQQAAKFHQTGRLEGFEIPLNEKDSFVGP